MRRGRVESVQCRAELLRRCRRSGRRLRLRQRLLDGSNSGFLLLLPSSLLLPFSRSRHVVGEATSGSGVDGRGLGHRVCPFIGRSWPWRAANGGWRRRGYVEGDQGLLLRVLGSGGAQAVCRSPIRTLAIKKADEVASALWGRDGDVRRRGRKLGAGAAAEPKGEAALPGDVPAHGHPCEPQPKKGC